ncbi:hypothetical protein K3495_g2028 [Podosphaera aphanis]|nr:hypothetical protein K3495_g2028 [Podosphaera aphanis]
MSIASSSLSLAPVSPLPQPTGTVLATSGLKSTALVFLNLLGRSSSLQTTGSWLSSTPQPYP